LSHNHKIERKAIWRLAFLTGLITSTFSTLVIALGAPRIGRDVNVSWMEVSTVILRDSGVQLHPGWREILFGILLANSKPHPPTPSPLQWRGGGNITASRAK